VRFSGVAAHLRLLAVLLGIVCAVTGCGANRASTSGGTLNRQVQAGDCLRQTTGEREPYEGVACTTPGAAWRVLKVGGSGTNCYDVPGVERAESRIDGIGQMCLSSGPGEPRPGVNTAQQGDCLTSRNAGDVRAVPCTDPGAVDRVLARVESGSYLNDDCAEVPGTRSTYEWKLTSINSRLSDLEWSLVFCLAPKDEDPNSSVDAAKVGDCLAQQGEDYTRVACDTPNARYRVLERYDSTVVDIQIACRYVQGATSGIKRSFGDLFAGYTLCLGPR
jgi:hypothetical protein